MKKNLLVLLPALCLALTACNESAVVEAESDETTCPSVEEVVTINDFSLTFDFTKDGEKTSIPGNASMYIIGSWDNWAEFLPVTEKDGTYSYTFPVIIEGDYEFKGVMWYSDQDVSWTNCVEIVTEEGGSENATFSTSDGSASFTRELSATLEPRNPSELMTKLGETGSYTMVVEYTEAESSDTATNATNARKLDVSPTMGIKCELSFSYDRWGYTKYDLVIPEEDDDSAVDDEENATEPYYELSSTYICFNTDDGSKDAYFYADGSFNVGNDRTKAWTDAIVSLFDAYETNLFDFLAYQSSGTIDDVACDAYTFDSTPIAQQAYYILFSYLSSSYVLSGYGGSYAIYDENIAGADFVLYYFNESQAMLMDYVNDTTISSGRRAYSHAYYEYSATVSKIGETEVDIDEWIARLPSDNEDDEN